MPETLSPLAHQIAALIQEEALPAGAALTERALAERFRLSRSPIRSAMKELQEYGVLASAGRGLAVADPDLAGALAGASPQTDVLEEVYLAMARDRLAGVLPDKISENELLRRYDLTRPRLHTLLRRISEEGWIERLPGHGWAFQPVLTSTEGYLQSYRFRQAIEPAALLEPGFKPNVAVLNRHLERQYEFVEGAIITCSAVELFRENSALHEAITECSGNAFFIESLRRVDRLRRLMEYRMTVDREKARMRCAEHIRILTLVLAGENEEAADLMRRHLTKLGPIKARHAESHR